MRVRYHNDWSLHHNHHEYHHHNKHYHHYHTVVKMISIDVVVYIVTVLIIKLILFMLQQQLVFPAGHWDRHWRVQTEREELLANVAWTTGFPEFQWRVVGPFEICRSLTSPGNAKFASKVRTCLLLKPVKAKIADKKLELSGSGHLWKVSFVPLAVPWEQNSWRVFPCSPGWSWESNLESGSCQLLSSEVLERIMPHRPIGVSHVRLWGFNQSETWRFSFLLICSHGLCNTIRPWGSNWWKERWRFLGWKRPGWRTLESTWIQHWNPCWGSRRSRTKTYS